jgi:mono/diheme cytochrome c family protein
MFKPRLMKCGAGALARIEPVSGGTDRARKTGNWSFPRKPVARRGFVLGVSMLVCIAIPTVAQSPNEQLPAGAGKEKAEAACLTCHEARVIVQQRLSKATWAKEVDKMTNWGAEVDPRDRDALIEYLSANFGPNQAAYEAPKSASESKSKTKAKH